MSQNAPMTLTDPFPAHVQPVRVGVYPVHSPLLCDDFYSFWDGSGWGRFVGQIPRAAALQGTRETPAIQRGMTWRGLTAP